MNVAAALNTKAGMVGAGVVTLGLLVYFYGRQLKGLATGAVTAIGEVNQGTPYEGAGVVGTLGNITNQISGGSLQRIGEWLGGKTFDLFNKPYDPNVANTPAQYQAASKSSPVRPEDTPSFFLSQ